jgi:dTDP-4-amino-4,6-dideoxygalactose transaminase
VFQAYARGLRLPHAEQAARRCLSLPIYPELPLETVDRICEVIRRAL